MKYTNDDTDIITDTSQTGAESHTWTVAHLSKEKTTISYSNLSPLPTRQLEETFKQHHKNFRALQIAAMIFYIPALLALIYSWYII